MYEWLSRRSWLMGSLGLAAWAVRGSAWKQPIPLGSSGLAVTPLGMGAEPATDPGLIRRAVDLGINYFHCLCPAKGFGSLPVVGKALAPVRDKVVLGAGSGVATHQAQLDELDRQLRAFRTGYIDLWYLTSRHKPEDLNDDLLEAIRAAKQAGKIRAAAISTHGLVEIVDRLLEVRDFVSAVMVTCNFAAWAGATETPRVRSQSVPAPGFFAEAIPRIHQAGIGIVAMKPMMGGLKFVPEERKDWAGELNSEEQRRAALAAALKWVLRNEHVDTTPVQMKSAEELERNVNAASEPFTESDTRILARTLDRISPYYCRMCRRCSGTCREGLPVDDVLRALLYAEGYGSARLARATFDRMPARQRAARCESCDGCTVRCPNGVRVREQLTRAQAILS